MRHLLIISLLATPAFADDEPAPAPPPADPEPPTPPEEPKPEPPNPKAESPITTTAPTSSAPRAFDDMPTSVSTSGEVETKSDKPKLAVELSLASGQLADPFIQYRGWSLENGISKGTRLEGNLGGILVAYELSSMSNAKACIAGGDCLTGDFGSTTMHSLEVGYRYRTSKLLVLRPFIAASLGGVIGNAGDWAMSSGAFKGGLARAVAGVELPISGKIFGSASIGYRFMVVENPYHSKDLEKLQAVFINAGKAPNGDYVEDLHSIAVYLGVGVSL